MKNILICLFFLSNIASAQAQKIIRLKQQKAGYHLKNYHIAGITDDRPDTTIIGATANGDIVLEGGAGYAINKYVHEEVTQSINSTPITAHIKKLSVDITGKPVNPKISLSIAIAYFYMGQELVTYSGNSNQQVVGNTAPYIDNLIRQQIEGSLKNFDDWWHNNKAAATAPPVVKVNVNMAKSTDDTDLLVFRKQTPLVINDFQGEPDDLSLGAAMTFGAIELNYTSQTKDRSTAVDVTISALFDKTKSWCRAASRSAKTLSHEQIHFDIIAIYACDLLKKIKQYSFTPDNYAKALEQIRKENLKAMQQEQELYDKETRHGTIAAEQERWSLMVKENLQKQDCY